MRNVTVSMEEEVARWARIAAAERELSLSRFVGVLLRERMDRDRAYELAMKRTFSRAPTPLKAPGDRYPTREEIHDRPRVRR
jgi:hypothetical protein